VFEEVLFPALSSLPHPCQPGLCRLSGHSPQLPGRQAYHHSLHSLSLIFLSQQTCAEATIILWDSQFTFQKCLHET